MRRLRADLDLTLKRETMISQEYDRQAKEASVLDSKVIRYNMIKRNVDSDRHLYETLLQRVGEVGIAAAMRTSTIRVVDPAVAPLAPYSPNRLMNLGIGIFGGAFFATALSIFRLRTSRTINAPGETSACLQVRELGVIPSLKGRGMSLTMRKDRDLDASRDSIEIEAGDRKAKPKLGLLLPKMSSRSIALATWLRIPEMADAIFGAMNSMLLASEKKSGGRVTLLTSPEPGDGKTTVAANLALALAQIGRKVVLVDGDLRQPRLHTVFDKAIGDGGMGALLVGDDELQESEMQAVLLDTGIPGLSLIGSRPLRDGVVRKLHSKRMHDLVSLLRENFDEIVIDSPPMLQISDARVLAALADGVLLVVRSGKTTQEAALAAYDCLLQDGVRVLGTILNGWDRKGPMYKHYSNYFKAAS